MNNTPLVSIIIPVYKVEPYLEKSVLSALNQSYKKIEIILVDDGSPDKCPELCDKLCEKYSTVRVIHQKNKGLSGARNTGINNISSESEYIVFLDSDDQLISDAVEGMVGIAEKTGCDMVIPDRYIQVNEATNSSKFRYHFKEDAYYSNPIEYALEVILGQGRGARAHSLLYRTEPIVNSEIVFPEGYTSEDVVFNLRLIPVIKNIEFYPHPTVYYLKRKGSITTTFDKNYAGTIWFIDQQAGKFLDSIGRENDKYALQKKEDLLCRNSLAYVRSILSKKNTMSKNEKIAFAEEFLSNKELDGVFNRKHTIPYFQSKKAEAYFHIMYFLLGHHKTKMALQLACLFC